VFFADDIGVLNCFVGVGPLLSPAGANGRFTLVKPELTAVNPPVLMAVNAVVGCGAVSASRSEPLVWPFTVPCRASVACRAGDSARRLDGVLTLERFMGLGAGLGVRGPPYCSSSSC